MDGKWLENLYKQCELGVGMTVKLPWRGKGGKMKDWSGVITEGIITLHDV